MAIEKTVNIDVNSKDAEKGFDKLADAIKELNNTFSKFQKTTEDGFDDVKDGAEKASKGVNKIGKTLKSIGSGAGVFLILTKAFEFFKEVGEKNQKVLDLFNTAFEVLSIAFNDFFNFIFDNAGGVVDTFKSIFNDPVQAIKDFGKSIYDGIIVRFNELVEVTGLIGKSFLKLIQGDFKGAFETIKEAGKETVDVFTGVDDSFDSTVEKVKEIGKSVVEYGKNTLKAAKANVLAQVEIRAEEVKKEFYKLGVNFSTFSSNDRCYVELAGLESSAEEAIKLLETLMNNAKASQVLYTRARKKTI